MQKVLFKENMILRLSFDFSLKLIAYCEQLEALKKFVITNQLLRSGTSICANAMEAQNAESKNDFIHKMKVAAKEADETQYWLMLCDQSEGYPDCKDLIVKLNEIQRVLTKILATSRRN
ncbi:four helix bundle protein [Longitalea arenae]|uniref:four helix bundle protein n=1 Tax=Longitalea arenae TaxID=2812558 RepID=UPI0019687CBC|nr:four helix bundle protein [Longitalea arenae]